MSNDTSKIDKWILRPPGGPAGPFWGIVTQSGKVIALQILERKHAEVLRIVGNVAQGDGDAIMEVEKYTDEIPTQAIIKGVFTAAEKEGSD